jgi:Alpha/beta hydrolase domain
MIRRGTDYPFGIAAILLLVFGWQTARAEVKQIVIASREPWLNGRSLGPAGAYEKLQGRVVYAINPKDAANSQIADVELAPRNSAGMVEFSGDFVLLRPVDSKKARSSVFLEILNRGRTQANGSFFSTERNTPFRVENLEGVKLSDAFLFEQGFTVAWVGWQFDLPNGAIRVAPPVAPVSSIVREAILLAGEPAGNAYSLSYCAADAIQPQATLTMKQHFNDTGTIVPRAMWSFAHEADGKTVPDACAVQLTGGFKPGQLYEAVYTGAAPAVAGLGLSAIRDFVSYLKYGGVDSVLRDNPESEKYVLGYGYSQSARLLRQYLYQGFTADERGRQTFDAMFIASAGAGRGSFNHRYAAPGHAGNSVLDDLAPVDLFPFSDGDEFDPVTGKRDGLLRQARKSKTLPKIFYTYSSTEYWARVGSLAYTDVNGAAELPLDADARLYFFAGTPHAHGPFPPAIPAVGSRFAYSANFASSGWSFRALLLDLEAWAVKGEQPPASAYPHLGKLVAREKVKFPSVPGMDFPSSMPQNWRMDFGKDFLSKGIITVQPPKLGPAYTVLVPQVDADGNDLGGIALPFLAVPLGTYTGWNYELPRLESLNFLAGLIGSFQQFPLTKEQRLAARDPRRSIEERYQGREDYLAQIHASALKLVERKLLRSEDVSEVQKESAVYWDVLTASVGRR